MARKKKADTPPPGSPAWMATFGDMMSLLLTFFILLVSFSTIQETKFQEAVGSLQGALGVLNDLPSIPIHKEVLIPEGGKSDAEEIKERVEKLNKELESLKKSDVVEISRSEKGLAIRLEDEALFDLGKAKLRQEAHAILDEVAETLKGFPNGIRVEGHTDDLPIRSERFPSNWELSSARATAVLRHMQGKGIDPRRLSAIGFGEWRPVVKNDSPEHRQKNRRVEIFMDVLPEKKTRQLGEHF